MSSRDSDIDGVLAPSAPSDVSRDFQRCALVGDLTVRAGGRAQLSGEGLENGGRKSPSVETVEFGFVPQRIMEKIRDAGNWRARAQGIEELEALVNSLDNATSLQQDLVRTLNFLTDLLDDVNFKVSLTALNIITNLVGRVGANATPAVSPLLASLSKRLGDTKIVIRQAHMHLLLRLMQASGARYVLRELLQLALSQKQWRVREESLNVAIAAMITFPRTELDLEACAVQLAPVLCDSKQRVRQAAMEAVALLANALGPSGVQPLVAVVSTIEHQAAAPGLLNAVLARLSRKVLPHLSGDGLVEHAMPIASSSSVAARMSGADVEWVLAASGGLTTRPPSGHGTISEDNTGAKLAGTVLPSLQRPPSTSDTSRSAPRLSSAGRKQLPWEVLCEKREQAHSAPLHGNRKTVSQPSHPPMRREGSWIDGIGSNWLPRQANSYTELHKARLRYQGNSEEIMEGEHSAIKLESNTNAMLQMQQQSQLQRLEAQALRQSQEQSLGQLITTTQPQHQMAHFAAASSAQKKINQNKILSASWPYQEAVGNLAAIYRVDESNPPSGTLHNQLDTQNLVESWQAQSVKVPASPAHLRPTLARPPSKKNIYGPTDSGRLSSVSTTDSQDSGTVVSRRGSLSMVGEGGGSVSLPSAGVQELPVSNNMSVTTAVLKIRQEAELRRSRTLLKEGEASIDSQPTAAKSTNQSRSTSSLDSPVEAHHSEPSVRVMGSDPQKLMDQRSDWNRSNAEDVPESAAKRKPAQTNRKTAASLLPRWKHDQSTQKTLAENGAGESKSTSQYGEEEVNSGNCARGSSVDGECELLMNNVTNSSGSSFGSDDLFTTDEQGSPVNGEHVHTLPTKRSAASTRTESTSSPPTPVVEELRQQPLADKPPVAPRKKQKVQTTIFPRVLKKGTTYSEQHRQRMAANQVNRKNKASGRLSASPVEHTDSSGYSSASSKCSQFSGSLSASLEQEPVAQDRSSSVDWDEEDDRSSHHQSGLSPSLQATLARRRTQPTSSMEDRSWQSISDTGDIDYWKESCNGFGGDSWQNGHMPGHNRPDKPPSRVAQTPAKRPQHLSATLPATSTPLSTRQGMSATLPSPAVSRLSSDEGNGSELKPFVDPYSALADALKWMANPDNWEIKYAGLVAVQRLAAFHSEVLIPQLHTLLLSLIDEVKNLRSSVARAAIHTLEELFIALGRAMDQDLEHTTKVLLKRCGDASVFIREEAERAVRAMTISVTPARCAQVLVSCGASNRNAAIRRSVSFSICTLVEHHGPDRILRSRDISDKVLPAVVQFTADASPEPRYYARKALSILAESPDFQRIQWSESQRKKVEDVMKTIRAKGVGELPLSARYSRQTSSSSTSSANSTDSVPSSANSRAISTKETNTISSTSSTPSKRNRSSRVEASAALPSQLIEDLTASDVRQREKGIANLLSMAHSQPMTIMSHSQKVFDAFVPRLNDANNKVALRALQGLQQLLSMAALSECWDVVVKSVVPAVFSALASRHAANRLAADESLVQLSNIVDPNILLPHMANASQFGNKAVKSDAIAYVADLFDMAFDQHSAAAKRHTLPVVWHTATLLNGGGRGVSGSSSATPVTPALKLAIAKLVHIVYARLGSSLQQQAQQNLPPHLCKALESILKSPPALS